MKFRLRRRLRAWWKSRPGYWRRLGGGALSRLHVGCGAVRLAGWINSDVEPDADMIIDIRRPLPFPDGVLTRVYLEHVLEHVAYKDGLAFLREVHRILGPGGIVRIAVPDLEDLVAGYHLNDWRTRFDWIGWPEYAFIKTRAEMLNVAFRWWGHQHLYDEEELRRILLEAGFERQERAVWGRSRHEDLNGLESRLDSRLVFEAER